MLNPDNMSTTNSMCPYLKVSLPDTLWQETGKELGNLKKQAGLLCSALYVKIVGKGVGMLWGFCKWWAWGKTQAFMAEERYEASKHNPG